MPTKSFICLASYEGVNADVLLAAIEGHILVDNCYDASHVDGEDKIVVTVLAASGPAAKNLVRELVWKQNSGLCCDVTLLTEDEEEVYL